MNVFEKIKQFFKNTGNKQKLLKGSEEIREDKLSSNEKIREDNISPSEEKFEFNETKINDAIEELKKAGYGSIKLEKFREEFRWYDKAGMVDLIEGNVATAVRDINDDRKILDRLLMQEEQGKMDAETKLFEQLYGDDYRKRGINYVDELKKNSMDIIKTSFEIKNGHDKSPEYANYLIERLRLHGVRDRVCEEIRDEFLGISQTEETPEQKVQRMDIKANEYINRNRENIAIYMKYREELTDEAISTLGINCTENQFIKSVLGQSNDELKDMYARLDKEYAKNPSELLLFTGRLNMYKTNDAYEQMIKGNKSSPTFGYQSFKLGFDYLKTEVNYEKMMAKEETNIKNLVKESLSEGVSWSDIDTAKKDREERSVREKPDNEKGKEWIDD